MNNNILSLFNNFVQNPIQALLSANLNIPQNILNNPQAIVQYLLSSGQVSQNQVNQAMLAKDSPMFQGLLNKN